MTRTDPVPRQPIGSASVPARWGMSAWPARSKAQFSEDLADLIAVALVIVGTELIGTASRPLVLGRRNGDRARPIWRDRVRLLVTSSEGGI